ncbi:MAG TPA: hypothetical protein PLR99_01945 [Polyangiaceae bacterium]|nr:hypothetical protein [Polyangiaceae bacterium]
MLTGGRRRASRLLACGAWLLGLAYAGRAGAVEEPTVYDNHQLYLIGSRAAGMGGAYTALACDEGALHYNPAGLVCARHSHLELVANAYMLQSYSVPRALGDGQDLSATTYHSIPSMVGGVYVLADGDESGAGRQAFGFSVSIPYSIALKTAPSSNTRNFLSGTWRDDVLAGDVGYGYQLTPTLGLGLSLGGMMRVMSGSNTFLVTRPNAGGGTEFIAADFEKDILAVGLRAKLGARWTPTRQLSLGLAVVTPTLDAFGTYASSSNLTVAGIDRTTGQAVADALPSRFTGKSAAGFPMRFAVGVAYTTERTTLSADASVNLPHTVRTAYDLTAVPIVGVTAQPGEESKLERVLQPNANVGAEVRVTRSVAIDVGAFTDLSAVPANGEQDRIHMFGLSAALSLIGVQTHGSFGASFSYGAADTKVLTGELSLSNLGSQPEGVSRLTRWNLVGVIGSNYSFLPDDLAAEAVERERKPKGAAEPAPPPPPAR